LASPTTPVTEAFRPKAGAADSSSGSGEHGRFLPGAMLAGRYRIVGLLGAGGMGEVYRADDLKLGQAVALKLLPEGLADDPRRLEYFHNEVRLARQVSHPNVCRVYDIGEVDGQHFLSMEYVDGEDLAGLIRRIGRLPPDKGVDVARQLCAGLAAAHAVGVLHRDLKPANVMLDSRGRVRITDFGLAQLAKEEEAPGVRAGTPAYMAPEQLAGREVTERSDLYSLGLVLFEVFTGERALKADTPAELAKLHADSSAVTPLSITPDVDPTVERAILQCLENDPRDRPRSALAVAAALPGGDPLAAALAAGETPSPEMVAAAGESGRLRPGVAVACLLGVLACLCGVALLADRITVLGLVRHELKKGPQTLADRARDMIRDLGGERPDRPCRASGFDFDWGFFEHISENPPDDGWGSLKTTRPAILSFWYRESPKPLYPLSGVAIHTNLNDPPDTVPGMVSLRLDPRGDEPRLLEFRAVPPLEGDPAEEGEDPWADFFELADIDQGSLEPAGGADWGPPLYADRTLAWEGKLDERTVRVEAGSHLGRPVYFQVVWPDWTWPDRRRPRFKAIFPFPHGGSLPAQLLMNVVNVVVFAAGLFLARRNLRLGRGDRRAALMIAVYVFSSRMLAWLVGTNHAAALRLDVAPFWSAFNYAVAIAAFFAIFYLALEPYARRLCPEVLISWSRLLAGRLRDPRIGRDLLVGVLFGVCWETLRYLLVLAADARGESAAIHRVLLTMNIDSLLGTPHLIAGLINLQQWMVTNSLYYLLVLVVLRSLLRSWWLAGGALALFIVLPLTLGDLLHGDYVIACGAILVGISAVYLLIRYGLVAFIAAWLAMRVLEFFPVTADMDTWYSGASLFALGAVAAMAVYGFYTSLAGRPVLGQPSAQG
jgi:serine/threonine-protein kinase